MPDTQLLRDFDDLREVLDIRFSCEQREAIVAPLEPGVIMAGAGTGKTTVMAARVVWLVGTGQVRPDQVLGLTFTRKAAGELGHRITAALGRLSTVAGHQVEASDITAATYDSFAGMLVRDHGLRIGVDSDARLITGAMPYQLSARVVTSALGPFRQLGRLTSRTVVGRLLQLDSALQSHLCSIESLRAHDEHLLQVIAATLPTSAKGDSTALQSLTDVCTERIELADLVERYREAKQQLGVVEFADQMALAARIVNEVDAVPVLVRDQFKVVLLDEYQDTSAAQAQLLQRLFSGDAPESGRGHAVTAVGDPFQAIYGWRGAAASNMTTFASMFPRADGSKAESFPLTINRRSGTAILEAANDVAATLANSAGANEQPGPLVAPENAESGEVSAARFESRAAEISWLVSEVLGAHRGGQVSSWGDIAVLVRRNSDVPDIFGALTDQDIPVEIVGLGGLLQLPEIADILATLQLCLDPTANAAAAALLSGPRWQVLPAHVEQLTRRAKAIAGRTRPTTGTPITDELRAIASEIDPVDVVAIVDAIDDAGLATFPPTVAERLRAFEREITELRSHSDEPVPDFVRRVMHTIGVVSEVTANPVLYRAGRAAQLDAFLSAVNEFADVDGGNSLAGLLAYFEAELDSGQGLEQSVPSDADSVKILTVHRAKGLEWELVFVPCLVDGVFPNAKVSDNWTKAAAVIPAALRGDAQSIPQLGGLSKDALGDYHKALGQAQNFSEDRLAYVAVTRARSRLLASSHVWNPLTKKPRQQSRYFAALLAAAERQQRVICLAAQPPDGEANPYAAEGIEKDWPQRLDDEHVRLLRQAARDVQAALVTSTLVQPQNLSAEDAALVRGWEAEAERLVADELERRRRHEQFTLPTGLSASALMRAARNPERFARETHRPMPRPATRAATIGSRFHEWVEQRFAVRSLVEPELELLEPMGPPVLDHDEQLDRLQKAFLQGPFADQVPTAVEVPFVLLLGAHQVRGRIDAVYELPHSSPHRFQVVDWKTSNNAADPLQLACYRLAWAEAQGLSIDDIDAVFYHVTSGEIVRPNSLPVADELRALVANWVSDGDGATLQE